MDFASPQLRSTSAAVHLFGASILAYCFSARNQSGHISWTKWRKVPWARWCIMLVFLDSWLFHVYAGLLIQGYGTSRNDVTCNMAIYLCIVIYCMSKILIYCFLLERVYVVWPHTGTRLSSRAYCLCLCMMLGYAVVAVLMMIGRNAFFQSDHQCVIGLKPFASLPLLSYDLFLNVILTSMFLFPLRQAHFRDVRLRKIARRTLLAAFVALTTSSINIAILTVKHGEEMGWVCLASCGLDVTINALVLYWVTGFRPDDHSEQNYLTTMNFSIPFTTHSAIIASPRSVVSSPEVVMPAPVQDKSKLLRRAPAPTATPPRALGASPEQHVHDQHDHICACPAPSSLDSLFMRDRSTNYPVAHTETIESVRCERRLEAAQMAGGNGARWRLWLLWRSLRVNGGAVEPGWRMEMPFQVLVTTERRVREVSWYPGGDRRQIRGM